MLAFLRHNFPRLFAIFAVGFVGPAPARSGEPLWMALPAPQTLPTPLVSRDASHWQITSVPENPVPGASLFRAAAFGRGAFLAVGSARGRSLFLSCADGKTWKVLRGTPDQASEPTFEGEFTALGYGRERFVACSSERLIFSSDGLTFAQGALLPKGRDGVKRSSPLEIACGDTEAGYRFVILGAGPAKGWRAVTGDGSEIEHFTEEAPVANSVAYGAGHFVVVGPQGLIQSSHDGQIWTTHQTSQAVDLARVIWNGARFIASGSGGRIRAGAPAPFLYTSPDAVTWIAQPNPARATILWARELSALLQIATLPDETLAVSEDLTRWRPLNLPAAGRIEAIVASPH